MSASFYSCAVFIIILHSLRIAIRSIILDNLCVDVNFSLSTFCGYISLWAQLSYYINELFHFCHLLQEKNGKKNRYDISVTKFFDRVKDDNGTTLTFQELYIGVLLVYNEFNKRLPGRHFDPPTKEQVRKLMEETDMNLDGQLDREEFVKFIRRITKDTFMTVSQGLIIALAVAPTVALLTKRSTENVPGVGKVVEKIPNSIYASLVTLVVVAFQQGSERA